ncbi:MAG: hypothetical protein HOP02_07095 [Methylococcaceae bacterium]|nr:hypothetical protein [Methylococcaceae bacterium]
MMTNCRVLVLIALGLIRFEAVLAESTPTSTPAPSTVPEVAPVAPEMSLEQATKQVITSHYASRVLSAKTEEINGRKVHVIKTLTLDGRIQQQTIAADTGVLLDIDNN